MLALLADENFNGDIVRGLLRRNTNVDILTHDVNTLTQYAYERVEAGLPMPGVLEVKRTFPVGQAIEEILLLAECSLDGEWEGQILYLPLS